MVGVLLLAAFLIGAILAVTAGGFARGGITDRAMEVLRELAPMALGGHVGQWDSGPRESGGRP